MDIKKTNIADTEWNMDISYNMFESPDRLSVKDYANETVVINKYAVYTEVDYNGEFITLLTMLSDDNRVFVTTSPAFIRTFERIMELAERSHVKRVAITFSKEKSRNNREYMTAVYAKTV